MSSQPWSSVTMTMKFGLGCCSLVAAGRKARAFTADSRESSRIRGTWVERQLHKLSYLKIFGGQTQHLLPMTQRSKDRRLLLLAVVLLLMMTMLKVMLLYSPRLLQCITILT